MPLEGVSLTPAFQGQPIERNEPLFWEHEGNRAVRDGRWKLVAKGPQGDWELYDIETDRVESRNLASQQPARVDAISRQWEEWARRCTSCPGPGTSRLRISANSPHSNVVKSRSGNPG